MENITIGQITTIIVGVAALISGVEFLLIRFNKLFDMKLAPIKKELEKNSLNTMKNTICNDNIPITERLIVGKEYIDKGGNGAVKVYVHKLEEEYERKIKGDEKL